MEMCIDRQQLERTVRLIGLFRIVQALGVVGVVALPILFREWGLSLSEVFLLQALFSLAMVVMEVPTGYAADLWGRKRSLIVGALAMIVAWCVYFMAEGFALALVAELLLAVGLSFYSGADKSLLKRAMAELGSGHQFTCTWLVTASRTHGAAAVVALAATPLVILDPRSLIVVELLAAVISLLLVVQLYDPFPQDEVRHGTVWHDLRRVVHEELLSDGMRRCIALFPAVISGVLVVALWGYEGVIRSAGLSTAWDGACFAMFNLSAGCGGLVLARQRSRGALGSALVVSLAILVVAVLAVAIMGVVGGFVGLAAVLAQQLVRGGMPLFEGLLQEACKEERGAKTGSFQSLISRGGIAVALLLGSAMSSREWAYIVVPATGFVLGVLLLRGWAAKRHPP